MSITTIETVLDCNICGLFISFLAVSSSNTGHSLALSFYISDKNCIYNFKMIVKIAHNR